MSTNIEYGILGLGLVCVTILMALRVVPPSDGTEIFMIVLAYAGGAARSKAVTNGQIQQLQATQPPKG